MPLLKDLDELVSADIISAETAGRITEYYETKKQPPNERFNIVLGILGALLVGFGIVLLVAHNWDEMSRFTQTIFAFLPLAVAQALCIFSIIKKNHGVAWRESSAVLLFFAMGSCMALVSQVYHITGTLESFILTWLLLTAPLVYIMRSSLVSLLVIACSTWYAVLVGYQDIFRSSFTSIPYFYLVFLLFVLPHYYQYFRSNRNSNFFHLHNWFLVISTVIALGGFVGKSDNDYQWIFIGYCSLFGIYYLLGESVYFRENRLFSNPFLIAGVSGTVIIFLLWSYEGLWNDLQTPAIAGFFYIAVVLLAIHTFLLIKFRGDENWLSDPMRFAVYILAASTLFFAKLPVVGLLIINAWILLIAMYYIRKGARNDHLGILNFGLLIIASLAILRFFDDSIPFIWRGLFFVLTGVGFFVGNYLLIRKRRAVSNFLL